MAEFGQSQQRQGINLKVFLVGALVVLALIALVYYMSRKDPNATGKHREDKKVSAVIERKLCRPGESEPPVTENRGMDLVYCYTKRAGTPIQLIGVVHVSDFLIYSAVEAEPTLEEVSHFSGLMGRSVSPIGIVAGR